LQILDGKEVAKKIRREVKNEIEKLDYKPGISVVLVGNDPASEVYVNTKHKTAEKLGMKSEVIRMPEDTLVEDLKKTILKLNDDDTVDAILVQSPLPKFINELKTMELINTDKDVDCFHPFNLGRLLIGSGELAPCTPAGIVELLNHYNIETEGKRATIIGRSHIVGKPMIPLVLNLNCTTTVCHSRTRNLKRECLNSDILIVAAGKHHIVTEDMVKEGAVVVDVGIHKIDDSTKKKGYRLEGDVDFDAVSKKASYISPVPGGVGPMTIAMLMKNCLQLAKARRGNK
jgi:methylenetetrahydrofolate dehydrogenase (NADP+) / methenyltetrahydrofolate cyclohydrolase